ncbi:lectin-like domain-containing protein, partial [Staphylococcus hominis]
MSKREKDFKRSFGEEKARVKLYKSGKHWVKAGIREFQLLKSLGLSFLEKDVEKTSNLEKSPQHNLKKQALRSTGFIGGAFTFAMLNDQHAFAASETPMTSEIASNSETVANQNSTAIKNLETSTSKTSTSQSNTSQSQDSTSEDSQSDTTSTDSKSTTHTSSTSNSEASMSGKQERQSDSSSSQKMNTLTSSNETKQTSTNSEKDVNSQEQTSSTSSTQKENNSVLSEKNPTSSSTVNNQASTSSSTITSSENSQHSMIETNSVMKQPTSTSEMKANTDLASTLLVSDSTSTSTSQSLRNIRTFSRLAINTMVAPMTVMNYAATTPATTVVPDRDVVTVTKDNFSNHFNVKDVASYDSSTGIVTLTPDEPSKKGSITLNTKINSNKSFNFTGKVNLGSRYEGYSPDDKSGGDGIGFAFSPGALDATGKEGAAVGIGGLANAFGFKLDTYHNTSAPKSDAKAKADPSKVAGGGAFGAFVSTDSGGTATTEATGAAKLTTQPKSNTFQDFVIDYNGDTKVMTVTYAGQTFTRNLSDWLKKNSSPNYALSITASTGGAQNLQQVQFGTFTYTQTAVAQTNYVDLATGKQIIPSKTYAGDVDNVVTLDKQESKLNSLGYQYVQFDSTNASTYNTSNNQVKLTNEGQSVTYFYKDVKAPTIKVSDQTNEVFSKINPLTVDVTDNSSVASTISVTGLPTGLTYDNSSKTITGTPTKIGTYTVTVTATDSSSNTTTQSFKWNITRNSTSDSASNSTSISEANSESASKSTAASVSEANSTSASKSTAASVSEANSTSASKSTAASISEANSTSTSDSASTSTSVSDSTSASTSLSGSASMSLSDSGSTSTSDSASTSTSVSDSGSTSTSDSASTSTSVSDSTSVSTSLSGSASTS